MDAPALFGTTSIDAIKLRNNAGLIASGAAGFKVPTVLTPVVLLANATL